MEAARDFPTKFVFRDTTGEIVVSYADHSDSTRRVTFRFWLQNRVDPHIRAVLRRSSDGTYVYDYTVANGPAAATAIWKWSIVGPSSEKIAISHPVWGGVNAYQSAGVPQAVFKNAAKGSYLAWIDMKAAAPIEPGKQLSGFEIVSPLHPGLTTAYVSGRESPIRVPEDAPDAVDQEIMVLERAPVIDKVAVTIGPRFAPDAKQTEIVRAYQRDIADLEAGGYLDGSSPFIEELAKELARAEASGQYSIGVPKEPPNTPIEREILEALRLAVSQAGK